MSRPLSFVPFGRGDGGPNQSGNRLARAAEAARGFQRFVVHQNVEVLDIDGHRWLPGRFVQDHDNYARVEVFIPSEGPQIRKVTKERLRPRTENP